MLNRFISLTLALRYLNPLRTYFSIITLICLLGVALGVMVLVVVLSVMGGLQKELQGRLLAFSPHLEIRQFWDGNTLATIDDWKMVEEAVAKIPEIESAYGVIEDNALIDSSGNRRPSLFRAIDTRDQTQMNELQTLIRDGTFELDFGEKAVISSILADSMGLTVGDQLGILTLRNLEEITEAYQQVEMELLITRLPEEVKTLGELVASGTTAPQGDSWSDESIDGMATIINHLGENARNSEIAILSAAISIIYEDRQEDGIYPAGTKDKLAKLLGQLGSLDKKDEDLNSFLSMKELVLPKDLEIIGVYQASQHTISPDIFLPLNIGQELLAFKGDSVKTIALRVKDPYVLGPAIQKVKEQLPALEAPKSWGVTTWEDTYGSWFSLMQRERSMMNFVLSFISLISAFCIMAVMFTVCIQRKKELAVIKSLGATPGQLVRIFLWQGVIIGLVGAILGVALGVLVLHFRTPIHAFMASVGFDPFPMDFHGIEIPAEIDPYELMIQAVKAFFMVVVASIVPAIITASQDPAKSLRSL